MITRLYIDKGFKHQDKTFLFDKGLTGVVGKNESGKSLIVEFIRYALFGSAALRGAAPDYKHLHVELDFTIGKDLTVIRKGSKVQLLSEELVIASGTKPVNAAIIEALGYDLKVFDVANACNQGNVEALSNMKPAERKQMVDKTVGLDVLDDLIKFCGEEAATIRRESAAFQKALVQPVAPILPEGYVSSDSIDLEAAEADLAEYNSLKGFLAAKSEKPKKPKKVLFKETLADLKQCQAERTDKVDALAAATKRLAATKVPEFTETELDAAEAQNTLHGAWVAKKKLLDQGHHECPKCNHQWALAFDQLEAFENVEETEPAAITGTQIQTHRGLLGNTAVIQTLEAQIAEIVIPDDRTGDLERRRAYDAELGQYQADHAAYERYNDGLAEKQGRFDALQDSPKTISGLRKAVSDAKVYEGLLKQFNNQVRHYESNLTEYNRMTADAGHYASAQETIRGLKIAIKSMLLPSLNKVASHILGQMSGGERYQVEIDDDFNIEIDGLPINTLSGSGKAVANLAIRIALGQILTNRVFSLFMADEVDASMDDDRAASTAESLRRLTDSVTQVVLVTHKSPSTDHLIELV